MKTKYQIVMDVEIEDANNDDFNIGDAIKEELNNDLLWPADLRLTDKTASNGFLVDVTNIKTSIIAHFKVTNSKSDNHERIGRLVKFITPERLQLEFDNSDSMFIYNLSDVIEVP